MSASGTSGPAPLRIHKHTASQDSDGGSGPSATTRFARPLSEVGPIEGRRNSVQYRVARRFGEDMASSLATGRSNSPRAFWLGNLQESNKVKDNPASPRRSSLENLKKASRVQNNKLLKQQLQNTSPTGRPLSLPPQGVNSTFRLDNQPTRASLLASSYVKRTTSPTSPPPMKRAMTTSPSPKATSPRSTPPKSTPPKNATNATLTSIMRNGGNQIRSPGRSSILASYKVNGRSDMDDNTGDGNVMQSPPRPKAVTFDRKNLSQVIEYELVTPVPSVDGSPCMSYDSQDESDEEYEYEYDNTPVIEPDHWRDTMPDRVATPPRLGDPFRASPSPTGRPLPPLPSGAIARSDSNSSNRPLPSIPFKTQIQSQQQISLHEKMQMMMQTCEEDDHGDPNEHLDHENNPLGIVFAETPVEQHAEVEERDMKVKSQEGDEEEIMDEDSVDLHEEKLGSDPQKETSLGTYDAGVKSSYTGGRRLSTQYEQEFNFKRPKKISRDSIRRHVNERREDSLDGESNQTTANDDEIGIQSDQDDDASIDMVPEGHARRSIPGYAGSEHDSEYSDNDDESRYSETVDGGDSDATPTATPRAASPDDAADAPTPTVDTFPNPTENVPVLSAPIPTSPPTPPKEEQESREAAKRMSVTLPEFSSSFGNDSLGLRDFMTPSPPPVQELPPVPEVSVRTAPTPEATPEPTPIIGSEASAMLGVPEGAAADRPKTPENQYLMPGEDLDRTPESVIRHKIYHSDEESDYDEDYDDDAESEGQEQEDLEEEEEDLEDVRMDTPVQGPARSPSPIPEDAATIRAPGGKLRTRPSATPADMAAMAAQRRQISGDHSNRKSEIYSSSESEGEDDLEDEDQEDDEVSDEDDEAVDALEPGQADDKGKGVSKKSSRRSLKMPRLDELHIDLNLDDISEEFDRVIETQKRGYLMRHSTRVIHASSRDIDDDSRPGGHKRNQSWQVEPWKGARRRSARSSLGGQKPDTTGPVPPLPGQADAANRPVGASDAASGLDATKPDVLPENGERGRLFVKVIGVKDLTLPISQREPTWFCLTLDNGLHCVTTSWLELAKNAPIGQEFELVVLNDLEFQLTLQTKLEKPPPTAAPAPPPQTPQPIKTPTTKAKSTFSRVFTTPKRRKELERLREQQQLQLLQQQQAQAQAQAQKSEECLTAWELLNGLVARDGSFARSYVCLKDFESRAYGRPFTTEINCFNEWAIEPNSIKTKRGLNPARRPPYKIGKLEVQMLFVPKPPGMTDKDLPKSMAAAIRELKEAESMVARTWEGYLSQQGGDCPFWRRRYFKLVGSKLTAYHDVSRQPRATINLSKASRLIDDRSSLTEPETSTSGGKRRKSAFHEMEEGYMFVEEGFRIKFGNGETIDFYADSAEEKKGWMKVLGETIGGGQENRSWCEVILNKEKLDREMAIAAQQRRIQQQQLQHQQFEKMYPPGQGPPPPPKSSKRPLSGIPAGVPVAAMPGGLPAYPQTARGSVSSVASAR